MKLCQYLQSNLCSNILGTILQLGSNVPYSHSTHKHWLAVWRLTSRTRRAINTRRYVIAQTGDTGWPRKCRVRLCKLLHREHGDLGIQLFNSSKSSHQNSKRDAHMEKELLCSALCSIKGPTSRKWMSSSSFPLIFFWSKLHGFLFLLAFTHLGANGTPSSSRQHSLESGHQEKEHKGQELQEEGTSSTAWKMRSLICTTNWRQTPGLQQDIAAGNSNGSATVSGQHPCCAQPGVWAAWWFLQHSNHQHCSIAALQHAVHLQLARGPTCFFTVGVFWSYYWSLSFYL